MSLLSSLQKLEDLVCTETTKRPTCFYLSKNNLDKYYDQTFEYYKNNRFMDKNKIELFALNRKTWMQTHTITFNDLSVYCDPDLDDNTARAISTKPNYENWYVVID